MMYASGALYGRLGAAGFLAMAALCLAAVPLAWRLGATRPKTVP